MRLIRQLASMKIAIALLIVLVIALAAGTIVESFRGTGVAQRAVYYAPWFQVLLGLFALNVLCSLIDHWPYSGDRAGFVMTHGSLVLILAGSLVTLLFKTEGRLALWEGEESARFALDSARPAADPPPMATLPFTVRLESFEIDTYPGTERPAQFRSRVTVRDTDTGETFPASIHMNHELSYRGYHLFQSSYQREKDRDRTILSVSRDPGQLIVFAGYTLLMIGMTTVLGIRIAQRRAMERQIREPAARPRRRTAAMLLLLGLIGAIPARAASVPDPGSVERLRRMPVQHDGRVMPFDTLAREALWSVTGKRTWAGTDPAAVALGWILDPQGWSVEPIVRVGPALAAEIGLPPGQGRASFQTLAMNRRLIGLMQQAREEEQQERPVAGLLKEARKVEGRLIWLQHFLNAEFPKVYPVPADPQAAWSAALRPQSVADLLAILDAPPTGWPETGAIEREITYNRIQPTRAAWWILSLATLLSLLAWNLERRWIDFLAVAGLLLGFGMMTWGLAVRWQVAGRIPASDMYESMLFLGWGVGLFAVVAILFLRNRLVVFNATAMSALAMLLSDRLPLDPFIHPVAPVLAGTVWLAIHVPIIMVSYSVLALGVLVAHMQIGFEMFAPARRDLAMRMNDLLYWYTHVGSILLIAGILTGSIWASFSWGRYWGWDPKEVWSLVAFLAYLAILHGRFERYIGPFGVAALSIVAFWMIVMTYVGVNFVLASGLHSYGFGDSAVVRWLLLVGGIETAFLGSGLLMHLSRRDPRRRRLAPS